MPLSAHLIPDTGLAHSMPGVDGDRAPDWRRDCAEQVLSPQAVNDVIALATAVSGCAVAQVHLHEPDAVQHQPATLVAIATEPLLDAEGQQVGSLRLFDRTQRPLSAPQQAGLAALARQISHQIVSQRAVIALESALQRLEILSSTDALTGLQNRRAFEQRIRQEFERARRYDLSLSFLMLDVDFFKHFNDLHGHQAGDRMLHRVAQTLQKSSRGQDTLARFGGEEFVVVLPNTGREGALVLAERYRLAIESLEVAEVTVSIGVATLDAAMQQCDDLVNAADRALYRAKGSGRNKVIEAAR